MNSFLNSKSMIIGMAGLILSFSVKADYIGSSFSEVLGVIKDSGSAPAQAQDNEEWSVYRSGVLPQYKMNFKTIFHAPSSLQADARRTLSDGYDYYERLTKKLHPNGVCVAGTWNIENTSPYTGLFRPNQSLFIGRISVAMEATDFDSRRGFGFAGKIFPTMDVDQVAKTANFFTVDVLTGQSEQYFMKTSTTNQPEIGFPNLLDLSGTFLGIQIKKALEEVDSNPGFRPLTPIASSGETLKEIKQPKWMRLKVDQGQILNTESDFRNEVLKAVAENKLLKVGIYVSDKGPDRNSEKVWTRLGTIKINRAYVSYGCDRKLHFAHPAK